MFEKVFIRYVYVHTYMCVSNNPKLKRKMCVSSYDVHGERNDRSDLDRTSNKE